MSLLVLMYHRARAGPDGNAPAMLDAHFGHIARHCRNVMPGEEIERGRTNVCVSFDDGYFDFYTHVFPLLRRHGLRALLAVPPAVVIDGSMGEHCTWRELKNMANSGHVAIAAHGFNHVRLDAPEADLSREVTAPKTVLASRLAQPIDSFVFPYGRFSREALMEARRVYRYVFRIGGAANRGWEGSPLYRIGADGLRRPDEPFTAGRALRYRARYLWNRARGR